MLRQKPNWTVYRITAKNESHCTACFIMFERDEVTYSDPIGRLHCTRCAVNQGATVEKSPQVQAKIAKFKSRLLDFIAGEIERRLK